MGKHITVTYTDLHRDAPRVTQYGIEFITGRPVTIDVDDLGVAAPLAVHKWRTNPWFSVEGADKIVAPNKTAPEVDPRDIDPDDQAEGDEAERDEKAKAKAAKAKAEHEAKMKEDLDKLTGHGKSGKGS